MEAPASCEQYTHNNIKQKRINAEKSFQGLLPELFLLTFNWFIDFLLDVESSNETSYAPIHS